MSDIHERIVRDGAGRALATASSQPEKKAVQIALAFLGDESTDLGFVHPVMCLTVLPHRMTPSDQIWSRSGPKARLEIVPVRQSDGTYAGVPFGPKARLILLYLQSEAIRTGSRQIELGRSMRSWMQSMGIKSCGKNIKTVLEQSRRIENCIIRFSYSADGGEHRWQDSIIRGAFEPFGLQQREGSVELSDGFFRALSEHPVPITSVAIKLLADTCMPLDLYLWMAYRLHALSRPTLISWEALHAQFGAGTTQVKHFKPRFVRDLCLAMSVYPEAKVELTNLGARLLPSAPASVVSGRVAKVRSGRASSPPLLT